MECNDKTSFYDVEELDELIFYHGIKTFIYFGKDNFHKLLIKI